MRKTRSNQGSSPPADDSGTSVEESDNGKPPVNLDSVIDENADLRSQIYDLKQLVNQLVSDNVGRTSSQTSARKTKIASSANESGEEMATNVAALMLETAKLAASSAPIERTTKLLTGSTESKWRKFYPWYQSYKIKKGIKKLYDLMDDDTVTAYEALLEVELKSLSELDLVNQIESFHGSILTGMATLKANLVMATSNTYDKENIQDFVQLFLVILKRFPHIKNELHEKVIISYFFSVLQPPYMGKSLELLKLESISEGLKVLKLKLVRKDISIDETKEEDNFKRLPSNFNSHKKSSAAALNSNKDTHSDGPILNKAGKLIECLNCKHAKNPNNINHFLWNCYNLSYCYQCKAHHFPMGPECEHQNSKVFDYETYLKRKGENTKTLPSAYPSTDKKKKLALANGSGDQKTEGGGKKASSAGPSNEDQIKILKMQMIVNKQRIAFLQCQGVKKKKASSSDEVNGNFELLFDSGANDSFVNNDKISPIRMTPTGTVKDTVTIAAGNPLDIQGEGDILNHTSKYIPEFHTSLLSVYQTLKSNDSLALFTDNDVHVVKNFPIVKSLFNLIINLSKLNQSIVLDGKVVNGLYIVTSDAINKNNVSDKYNLKNIKLETRINEDALLNEQQLLDLIHNLTINIPNSNFVAPSYYTNIPTVQVNTAAELVRYFHEAWNHASKEIMCSIVENKLMNNLPKSLTVKLINKYFPMCDACPHGNLSKRPIISQPMVRDIETGEEWQVDVKEWRDDKGKVCPTFSGAKWSLTCHDMNSKFTAGFLLQNKVHLLRYLKNLKQLIQ